MKNFLSYISLASALSFNSESPNLEKRFYEKLPPFEFIEKYGPEKVDWGWIDVDDNSDGKIERRRYHLVGPWNEKNQSYEIPTMIFKFEYNKKDEIELDYNLDGKLDSVMASKEFKNWEKEVLCSVWEKIGLFDS